MSEGATPPTVPPPLPEEYHPQSPIAQPAAMCSLFCPLIGVAIGGLGRNILGMHPDETARWGYLVLGWMVFALMLAGIVLGIIALAANRRAGARRIMGQAAAGLVLNIALIALFGFALKSGILKPPQNTRSNEVALAKMRNTVRDTQRDVAKELLNPESDNQTNAGSARLDKFQRSAEDAGRSMSGTPALIMKASAAFLAKESELTKSYEQALQELKDSKVLVASTLDEKAAIENRRQTVRRFAAANLALKSFLETVVGRYRVELVNQGVPAAAIEGALKGYRAQGDLINPMLVRIRETDDRIAKGMLGVLDLFEETWGKWVYRPQSQKILFDDPSAKDRYNAYLAEIDDASNLQRQLQIQLGQQLKSNQPAGVTERR